MGLSVLLSGSLIAGLLAAATVASATTFHDEKYSIEYQEDTHVKSFYQYSSARDYMPKDRSTLIDNLQKPREDCLNTTSLVKQFVKCSPGLFGSDYISEMNNPEKSSSANAEQFSLIKSVRHP